MIDLRVSLSGVDKPVWPWNAGSFDMPATMPDGSPWPRISIVTPSYNQGQFLEETIRSVLLQGYPNLEYIIIDGGSTDNSLEIIKKYESWLAYWVSEPDKGQANAINKGFSRATGTIIAWLNSDDTYQPGTFIEVVEGFVRYPESAVIYGDANFIDSQSRFLKRYQVKPFSRVEFFFDDFIAQPAAFMRRSALTQADVLDESLQFCLDYDLWLRLSQNNDLQYIHQTLATYRVHSESKSANLQAIRWTEITRIMERFFANPDLTASLESYRNEVVGCAYWHASIEYFKLENAQEAVEQAVRASLYAPEYIQSQGFARMLVGSKATGVNSSSIKKIENYFNLLPDTVAHKKKGRFMASSRARALLALNPSVERKQASEYARWAIWHDFTWLANRHVLRRAIGI